MKKGLLFVAVISAFSFASCKKDRTCTCKSDQPGAVEDVTIYLESKKSEARLWCIGTTQDHTSYDMQGNPTTVKVTTTCTLK